MADALTPTSPDVGTPRPAPSRRGLGPLVLEYHAVSATWDAARAVAPAQLREQLEHLVRAGFLGATFSDAAELPPGAERLLVVTFDDAYLSVLEHAFPVLERLGIPGTVFVVTDHADDGRPLHWPEQGQQVAPHELDELAGLTWAQLAGLRDAGWEIGSHTRTHPRLTRLSDEDLERELRGSREACERALGQPCRSLAYPFGDYDERVVRMAAEAGYDLAAIEDPGPLAPHAWPRIGVYRGDDLRRFRLKVSPAFRQVRTIVEPAVRGLGRRARGLRTGRAR